MPEIQPVKSNPLQKYFRQPKIYISLPSEGKFYPPGSLQRSETNEYPVFAMTARDEMLMKTPDALLNGESTVAVIESCIPAIKNGWAVPTIDIDVLLVAIRIATFGDKMDIDVKVPVAGTEKSFGVNLQPYLDQFSTMIYNSVIQYDNMTVHIRPLTYREFTNISLKTFEEQRVFRVLNDDKMSEENKLASFNQSFKKLTDLTMETLEKSIARIDTDEESVTDPEFIKEFIQNADRTLFEKVLDHVEKNKDSFSIQPLVIKTDLEDIEKGAPEEYEVPITFDQSSFFG